MSGVEIVAAAAAVSLISSGASAYEQIKIANQSADLQNKQLRDQQVQLRLQENQATLERQKNLNKILATEEVTFGARNISGASGTVRAITMQNMHEFYEDQNADRLNYAAKQVALTRQREIVYMQRRAQVVGAVTGFLKEGANTVMAAYQIPGQSLMQKSAGASQPSANVGGSGGYQSFAATQRSQFDLNA